MWVNNTFSRSWLLRDVEYNVYFREHFVYYATFNIQV